MSNREELKRIRAAQDANEAMADEVQDRMSSEAWQALLAFNQYHAAHLGLTLEFYRRASGAADYRFRQSTPEEKADRVSDRIEDLG
jgi:hypothetical protein